MKIIISNYDDYDHPHGGGAGMSATEIAKRVAERGYEVTYISASYLGCRNGKREGVHYKYVGPSWAGPRLGLVLFSLSLPFYVLRLRNSFDLWIENFTPPFSTSFLQLFTRKPIIGVPRFLGGRELSKKFHLPFHWIEWLGLKTYRYFAVLTNEQIPLIKKTNADADMAVISDGVDASLFDIPYKPEKMILFLGRIDMFNKGLDLLLNAVRFLPKEYLMYYNIIVAGKGNDEHVLRNTIRSLNLESFITMNGFADDISKKILLSKALIMVAPSRWETQGRSVLEGMAAGLPVVIFDVPGFKWIPDDCVVKIPAFDTEAYRDAITTLLRDATLRTTIGARARAYARRFSWYAAAEKYARFIENITRMT